ncbi:MAG: hypothetical protein BWK76_25160 [Desulfobulbaceae bacterium A2]|nr:MAG: hypothetical protein BWK76_25160 [Desulfobulbaceae bacterium A2]
MTMPSARIRQRPWYFSPIWLLPLFTLALGGWLFFKGVRDAGIEISLNLTDGNGVLAGKTKVIFKGIPVGTVRKIRVAPDLNGVQLLVEMDKRTKKQLVEDTAFWLVRPEVSLSRISGLETLVSGSYIGIQPGLSHKTTDEFIALSEPPPPPANSPGLHLSFNSDTLGGLRKGSSIYYRQLKVGEIHGQELTAEGAMRLHALIDPQYQHLVHEGSRFWHASGINLSAGLSGIEFEIESLPALLTGGVAFETPASLSDSPLVSNGANFSLFKNYKAAEYGIPVQLRLKSGEAISEGFTKVLYRGLQAGEVTKVTINPEDRSIVTAHLLLDPRAEPVLRRETRFWIVRPEAGFTGLRNLDTVVKGAYITFQPGDGDFCDQFTALETAGEIVSLQPGKTLLLRAQNLGTLNVGSPLLFKGMTVGEVVAVDFGKDHTIEAQVRVFAKHAHLVRENSVFWDTGGISLRANPGGVNLQVGSLKSILAGGVTFATPEPGKKGPAPAAHDGQAFTMHPGYYAALEAVTSLRGQGLPLRLRAQHPLSIQAGAPVLFKKLQVGEVIGHRLDEQGTIVVEILIDRQHMKLVSSASRFFGVSGIQAEASLAGVKLQTDGLRAVFEGGIAFETPEGGDKAQAGAEFTLFGSREDMQRQEEITITLVTDEANAIRPGTVLRHRGVSIGQVHELRMTGDLAAVQVLASVSRQAETLLREGTNFLLVTASVGLGGVEHAETVLTGAYLQVQPGSGKPSRSFPVTRERRDKEDDGVLTLVLETERLGSLRKDAPVLYRQVQVGRVTGYELAPDGRDVWVQVRIEPAYADLVRANSKFWHASGVSVKAGLFSGVNVAAESLETLLAGGVALATPEEPGQRVAAEQHFILHGEAQEDWHTWRPALALKKPLDATITGGGKSPARKPQ